jgi:hypothetical protein
MGYVKISDPNIIDLNAIHNIINVVNQHSDTLNTLTNNLGQSNSKSQTYSGTDIEVLFDNSSQMIIYGRTQFTSTDSHTTTTFNGKTVHIYYQTVTFSDSNKGIPAFTTASPIVTASLNIGSYSTVGTSFPDAQVNVYSLTSTSFKLRLVTQTQLASGNTLYANWVAIGPKNK